MSVLIEKTLLNFGDLDPYPNFDLTKILRPGYEKSEELKTADEQVKRLFTLEFGTKDDILEYYTNHLVKAVQRHPLDQSSYEVLIAKITARIRMHIVDGDKDPFSMKRRKTVGDLHVMRNYLLNKLMHSDYDVYEWLKSILRIEHQHENPFAQVEHNARELERMKLQQQAFDIVQKKKDELKLRFANEKQKFQLEKEQLLIDIEKDLQNLRLDIIKYNEIRKQRTRTKVE
ncbi:unnamed protein product [Didymodactylos carnosus]|uniref:Small ribosomal subunit protein uS15m n=1 Tax=Didymodactylos carnosus TaxID=1234261 RepID=A0A813NMT9_9BILA|nr:unnamed protein product [Didymodactylos carnosus]CAF0774137.1 unnamed protein product [Didymodactylos carnosus]CAF3520368.1 unnamed protein product [Didymodactylos carnosus]CAF3555207.1 unnamed protein product [Didymodactylos carnosus]